MRSPMLLTLVKSTSGTIACPTLKDKMAVLKRNGWWIATSSCHVTVVLEEACWLIFWVTTILIVGLYY